MKKNRLDNIFCISESQYISKYITRDYPPGMPLEEVVLEHIRRTLKFCFGDRTKAARLLRIGRNTLVRKLKNGGLI